MAKYVLFMGTAYYPLGGMSDFAGAFDTMEEIQRIVDDRYVANKQYPLHGNSDDMWAQIALVNEDGIHLIFDFSRGEWEMNNDLKTATLEGNVVKSRDMLEEAHRNHELFLQREAKKKLTEELRQQGWEARKRDDVAEVERIHQQLLEMGEDW